MPLAWRFWFRVPRFRLPGNSLLIPETRNQKRLNDGRFTGSVDLEQFHLPRQFLSLVLVQIEKQPRRDNVIHTIVTGRMRLNILVHITDFRLDLWTETISDPDKAAVLIKPLVRLETWPPVRIIQINEHLIPHHEICSRKERDRPGEFQKLTEARAGLTTVCLPALFKP